MDGDTVEVKVLLSVSVVRSTDDGAGHRSRSSTGYNATFNASVLEEPELFYLIVRELVEKGGLTQSQ